MLLNFSSVSVEFCEVGPFDITADYICNFVDPKSNIITKIHLRWFLTLTVLIVNIKHSCQFNLKVCPCVMIHKKEKSNNSTKQTTDIWDNSIELDKSSFIVMFSGCFSEPESRVPASSYFLGWNCVGSCDDASILSFVISIRQYAIICEDIILRDENFMRGTQLTTEVDKILIGHVVRNTRFRSSCYQWVDIVNGKMNLFGELSC